jgi:hypothetical protein
VRGLWCGRRGLLKLLLCFKGGAALTQAALTPARAHGARTCARGHGSWISQHAEGRVVPQAWLVASQRVYQWC